MNDNESIHSGDYCPDCGEPIFTIDLDDKLSVVVDREIISFWTYADGGIPMLDHGQRPHSNTCKRRVNYNGLPTI